MVRRPTAGREVAGGDMGDRLKGKVAIVTGAGSGIGRAAATRFAAEGARVWCADLDPVSAAATASGCRSGDGWVEGVEVDVAEASSVAGMVDAVLREHGRIDVLYSNAGIIS